jgi:hypothetical protein
LFAKFVASVKALITTNQNLSMKRQECLDLHLFDSVEQAQNLTTQWLWVYNTSQTSLMLVVLFCSLIFKAVSRRWGSFRDFLLKLPWQSVILVHYGMNQARFYQWRLCLWLST